MSHHHLRASATASTLVIWGEEGEGYKGGWGLKGGKTHLPLIGGEGTSCFSAKTILDFSLANYNWKQG